MKFFIPHLRDDPVAAEAEWVERYGGRPDGHDRIYSVTYVHERAKFVVTVGEVRIKFARQTGPRGGHIKDAGHVSYGQPTGTTISGIVDTGDVLHVWSYGPPFKGWDNPSFVGRSEITQLEHFKD